MKIKEEDIKIYLILGGIGILAYYILPPLMKILSIPGAIVNAPGEAIEVLKTNQKSSAKETADIEKAKLANQKTSLPGISTDTLANWIDEKAVAKFSNTPIRTAPKSNATVLKYVNAGNVLGYIYSATNEVLAGKNKTWIWISDYPGSEPFGYIPYTDITIPSKGINGIVNNNNIIN
jgi:hypothetical protein